MEALQLKSTERNLAKCEPALPSSYSVEKAADRICMRLTFGGNRAPSVEVGFEDYVLSSGLLHTVYDPAGELTGFGAKLFDMFEVEWASAVEVWK